MVRKGLKLSARNIWPHKDEKFANLTRTPLPAPFLRTTTVTSRAFALLFLRGAFNFLETLCGPGPYSWEPESASALQQRESDVVGSMTGTGLVVRYCWPVHTHTRDLFSFCCRSLLYRSVSARRFSPRFVAPIYLRAAGPAPELLWVMFLFGVCVRVRSSFYYLAARRYPGVISAGGGRLSFLRN